MTRIIATKNALLGIIILLIISEVYFSAISLPGLIIITLAVCAYIAVKTWAETNQPVSQPAKPFFACNRCGRVKKSLQHGLCYDCTREIKAPPPVNVTCGHDPRHLYSFNDQIYCEECGRYYTFPKKQQTHAQS